MLRLPRLALPPRVPASVLAHPSLLYCSAHGHSAAHGCSAGQSQSLSRSNSEVSSSTRADDYYGSGSDDGDDNDSDDGNDSTGSDDADTRRLSTPLRPAAPLDGLPGRFLALLLQNTNTLTLHALLTRDFTGINAKAATAIIDALGT